jgi:RNA polymerase sigma factor (sigma-70 family)
VFASARLGLAFTRTHSVMSALISDESLIEQALSGRQVAYSTLVKRYEHFVFTLCMRMVKQREAAHEVAQDSFMRAFRYLSDFRGESKFSTWLYKIVYTTALNHLRKNNPSLVSLNDDERPIQVADADQNNIGYRLEIADRNAALQTAINELSPDDSTIITLFYLYEHSLEEICTITGLTFSNAKTKLCRARQRLRIILEDRPEVFR